MLKAPLSVGDFNAAVGNQTWLKHWPFGRLLSAVSTCIQEHQCHTIIGLIPDIGSLWHCFSKLKVVMAVTTTQTFFNIYKYVLYIPNSCHPFGRGRNEPHWQTIPEGPKTNIS